MVESEFLCCSTTSLSKDLEFIDEPDHFMTLLYPSTHGRLEESAGNPLAHALGWWDHVVWRFQNRGGERSFEDHHPVTVVIVDPESISGLVQRLQRARKGCRRCLKRLHPFRLNMTLTPRKREAARVRWT